MPLEIEIRPEEHLVITRWIGSMSDRDLIDADDELRKNPTIKPEFDQLADLRKPPRAVFRAGLCRS